MPRPVKPRIVENMPRVNYYKPAGIPMRSLKEIVLSVDEFEALRLKDMEKLEQNICAEKMGVAQSTFQRIITIARQKLITCLVEGKALRIEGGKFDLTNGYFCLKCNRRYSREDSQKTEQGKELVETGANECRECSPK